MLSLLQRHVILTRGVRNPKAVHDAQVVYAAVSGRARDPWISKEERTPPPPRTKESDDIQSEFFLCVVESDDDVFPPKTSEAFFRVPTMAHHILSSAKRAVIEEVGGLYCTLLCYTVRYCTNQAEAPEREEAGVALNCNVCMKERDHGDIMKGVCAPPNTRTLSALRATDDRQSASIVISIPARRGKECSVRGLRMEQVDINARPLIWLLCMYAEPVGMAWRDIREKHA